MSDFVGVAFGFPTALFSVLLIVVILYWIVVLFGGLDHDTVDGHVGHLGHDHGHGHGHDGGVLSAIGLGGVPVTISFSLLVLVGWFVSLVGAALLHGGIAPVLVLVVALVVAWAVTRLLIVPLRRVFVSAEPPSRNDFVGRPCVIRTSTVTLDFGQAEVHAIDGSSAIVDVRQTGDDGLRAGSTAFIYDYDPAGEFFWVTASPDTNPAIDPGTRDH
jgi:hypothetical protein